MFSRSKLLMVLGMSLLGLGCSHSAHKTAPKGPAHTSKDGGSEPELDASENEQDSGPGPMLDGSTTPHDASATHDDGDGGPKPHESDASVVDEPDGSADTDASVATKQSFAFCTDMRVTRDGAGLLGDANGELYRGDVVLRTSALDPSFDAYSITFMKGDHSTREGSVAASDVEDRCPKDMFFAYYLTDTVTLLKPDNSTDCVLPPGTLLRPRSAHEESGWVSFTFDTPPEGCTTLTTGIPTSIAHYVLAYPSDKPELPVLAPSRRAGSATNRCSIRQGAIVLDGYDLLHVQKDDERIAKLSEAVASGLCKPGNRLSTLSYYILLDDKAIVDFSTEEERFQALVQLAKAGVGDVANQCRMQNGDMYTHENWLFAPDTRAQIVDAFSRFSQAGICSRISRIGNVLGFLALDGQGIMREDTIEQFIDDAVTLAESGAAEPGGVCTLQSNCLNVDGACAATLTNDRATFDRLVELGRLGTCAPHTVAPVLAP